MANSFAPVQFLRTDWNPDIWTAVDNSTDQRTSLAITLANAAVLPDDKEKFQVGCILIQKAEKQIYLNVGTDIIPDWQPFGPGTNTLPTPFVPGQYLTNDGTTAFWSLVDLATGVTGILDITHLDMSQIIDYLLSDTYFLTQLGNNSTFINALTNNTLFQNNVNSFISGGGGGGFLVNQTPDNGNYSLLIGDVDGTNAIFNTSSGEYIPGRIIITLNGIVQTEGDDFTESDPTTGEIEFVIPPVTGDKITALYVTSQTVLDDHKVFATGTDSNAGFLDDKITVVSTDNSVGITKTILSPGADEEIQYDLSASGSSISSGKEYYFGNYNKTVLGAGGTSYDLPDGALWKFGDYLILESSKTNSFNPNSTETTVLKIDPVTGNPELVATPWTLSSLPLLKGSIFVNEDQTRLYVCYSKTGTTVDFVIDEFDSSFTNIATYTYTGGNNTILFFGPNLLKVGSNFYVHIQQPSSAPIATAGIYMFQISGSSLINPTITNSSLTGQTSYDGTYCWGLGGKYTVSGTTFTSVSATFPTIGVSSAFVSNQTVYGVQVFDGKYNLWQPTGSYYIDNQFTGSFTNVLSTEFAKATLRQYPLPV